jgi:tetratricopeptide (TPR) repeat protein
VIELLLQGERALSVGLLDQAERLYRQAADADPRNSIAVVGLARVALERGDEPDAWRLAKRALEIDPENVAAQRLADRLEEVWAFRGESLPEAAAAAEAAAAGPETAPTPTTAREPAAAIAPTPADHGETAPAPATRPSTAPPPGDEPTPHRGLVDRLLRRNRP